jgi:uncharacterized membrane-anchored protein YjiN (DUF445 family)
MEQEQILSTLTEKLGKTSLSQKTLTDYVTSNLPGEGAEPDENYWNRHVTFLKSLDGNFSHDVATQIEDFKKNYKPQSTTPAPTTPSTSSTSPTNDDKLAKKLEEIEARLMKEENAKVQADLMKKVSAAMKDKQASDDYVLSKTLQGATFDTTKSVDELVAEYLPKYDAEYKACRGNGVAPRTTNNEGGTHHNAASKYFERKGKKEGWKK